MPERHGHSPGPHPVARALMIERLARGLTQADVAAELGVTHKVISWWETGRHDPGLWSITRYAKALGLRITIEPNPEGTPQ